MAFDVALLWLNKQSDTTAVVDSLSKNHLTDLSIGELLSGNALTLRFQDPLHDARTPMIIVGDLNIAPLETDVWSHKQLLTVVSHTPIEVASLCKLQKAAEFVDAVRAFIPPAERLYSWWSYRAQDWALSDRGRRLDHIWVTPPLRGKLAGAEVHRAARGWQRASDHVPVIVRLDG